MCDVADLRRKRLKVCECEAWYIVNANDFTYKILFQIIMTSLVHYIEKLLPVKRRCEYATVRRGDEMKR